MRKKLFVGMFLAAIICVGAGEFLFNRSGAQDAPKKADEKFVIPPPTLTLPALPTAPKETLTFPPLEPKALTPQPDGGLTIPPPVVNAPSPPMLPTPQTVSPPLEPMKPVGVAVPFTLPPDPPLVLAPKPTVAEPKKIEPMPVQDLVFPPLTTKDTNVKPAIGSDDPALAKPKVEPIPSQAPVWDPALVKPSTAQGSPAPMLAQNFANLKGYPWTLQLEVREGQTVVTATLNNEHAFKIACNSVDIQTGKCILKATGKVTITGDAFHGTCESLSIPLHVDRMVLEGGAVVSIQKASSNAYELKGETLNLRISDLHPERFLQTSMRKAIDVNVKLAAANAPTSSDKQWTPYGTLRRVSTKLQNENGVWQLEDRTGKVIATLVARMGGSLSQHEGQTISVYGTSEQLDGQRCLRVTHIALP